MTTINLKHFDKLSFVDEAKQIGFTEQQARLIAQKLEEVESYKNEEFATKGDIKDLKFEMKAEMKELEIRLIKWQLGIASGIIATVVASAFALLKMLH